VTQFASPGVPLDAPVFSHPVAITVPYWWKSRERETRTTR